MLSVINPRVGPEIQTNSMLPGKVENAFKMLFYSLYPNKDMILPLRTSADSLPDSLLLADQVPSVTL